MNTFELGRILSMAVQPICWVGSGAVSHYEALARVNELSSRHCHQSLVRTAEAEGFIDAVDMAIMDAAIRAIRAMSVGMAVNVSPQTISRHADAIHAWLAGVEGIAGRLVVEITEVRPIADLDEAARFAKGLQALGVRVALDDYGASGGFLGAKAVERIRPDFLKLDGVLVEQGLRGSHEFAEALTVARRCGCTVIAEFVDSVEKREMLAAAGVELAQGWLFGKAMAYPSWVEAAWAGIFSGPALEETGVEAACVLAC